MFLTRRVSSVFFYFFAWCLFKLRIKYNSQSHIVSNRRQINQSISSIFQMKPVLFSIVFSFLVASLSVSWAQPDECDDFHSIHSDQDDEPILESPKCGG